MNSQNINELINELIQISMKHDNFLDNTLIKLKNEICKDYEFEQLVDKKIVIDIDVNNKENLVTEMVNIQFENNSFIETEEGTINSLMISVLNDIEI